MALRSITAAPNVLSAAEPHRGRHAVVTAGSRRSTPATRFGDFSATSNSIEVSQAAPDRLDTAAALPPAAQLSVLQRLAAAVQRSDARLLSLAAVLGAAALLSAAEPVLAADEVPRRAQAALGDLADNEEFWSNVGRYISFYFSVLLGTAYATFKPVVELLKRPATAALVIVGAGALYLFVSTTVSAMLGVNDLQEYVPSSIVTPQL